MLAFASFMLYASSRALSSVAADFITADEGDLLLSLSHTEIADLLTCAWSLHFKRRPAEMSFVITGSTSCGRSLCSVSVYKMKISELAIEIGPYYPRRA
jgi:hypothetical protein